MVAQGGSHSGHFHNRYSTCLRLPFSKDIWHTCGFSHTHTYVCADTHIYKEIPATASLARLSPHHPHLPCIHRGTDGLQWLDFLPNIEFKSSKFQSQALLHAMCITAVTMLYLVSRHICMHAHSIPMLMVAITYTKSYIHVPKHFTTRCRNPHGKVRYIFEESWHRAILCIVFQTSFQLPSFLSSVSVCKPVLGEGIFINQVSRNLVKFQGTNFACYRISFQ